MCTSFGEECRGQSAVIWTCSADFSDCGVTGRLNRKNCISSYWLIDYRTLYGLKWDHYWQRYSHFWTGSQLSSYGKGVLPKQYKKVKMVWLTLEPYLKKLALPVSWGLWRPQSTSWAWNPVCPSWVPSCLGSQKTPRYGFKVNNG